MSALIALPILVLIGLFLLGGIIAIVMMLANPKTRVAGSVLLAMMLLVVILIATLIGGLVLFNGSGSAPFVYTLF